MKEAGILLIRGDNNQKSSPAGAVSVCLQAPGYSWCGEHISDVSAWIYLNSAPVERPLHGLSSDVSLEGRGNTHRERIFQKLRMKIAYSPV